jgi:putative signal transducing protein
MSTDPSDDIVRLVTAPNPAQAHIWAQGLKQAGVRCRVVGDYLNAGFGDVPGVRAEIWVHRDDVARAEDVLREMQTPDAGPDEDD